MVKYEWFEVYKKIDNWVFLKAKYGTFKLQNGVLNAFYAVQNWVKMWIIIGGGKILIEIYENKIFRIIQKRK